MRRNVTKANSTVALFAAHLVERKRGRIGGGAFNPRFFAMSLGKGDTMRARNAWISDIEGRVETALQNAVERLTRDPCPHRLAEALRYAVFPGGARIRPRLCLAVAWACGDRENELSAAAAAAIEVLHCASLVHDDLPCFDDALIRRARPALHRVFGEALAILTGDGLIIASCELLARADVGNTPSRTDIQTEILRAVGAPTGLVAGQAWEEENSVDLTHYHTCKTQVLFEAAAVCGALSQTVPAEQWRALGKKLGAAYQVADDIVDVCGREAGIGKPILRDRALGRPNIALERGLDCSLDFLRQLLNDIRTQVPDCPRREELTHWISEIATRLLAKAVAGTSSGGRLTRTVGSAGT